MRVLRGLGSGVAKPTDHHSPEGLPLLKTAREELDIINAYEETAGGFEQRGTLRDSSGQKLVIDGLWALEFGNGANAGPTTTLFFTAGPNDESHGLFGKITG